MIGYKKKIAKLKSMTMRVQLINTKMDKRKNIAKFVNYISINIGEYFVAQRGINNFWPFPRLKEIKCK